MATKRNHDETSGKLQNWASWIKVGGWFLAVSLLMLMFLDRPCIEYYESMDYCYEKAPINLVYIILIPSAVVQGYFVATLLESGARAIDYLRGIYTRLKGNQG
jgi:hypothetical protein